MENNTNTNQSEKKHNKVVSWFLGLPKWGKILLIAGTTGGVATAITVPVVLANIGDGSTKIDYATANAWGTSHLNFSSYIETTSQNDSTYSRFEDFNKIIDTFKSGNMSWDCTTESAGTLITESFESLIERSDHPEYLTNMPLKGSTNFIADKIRNDSKISVSEEGPVAKDVGEFMFIPKKETRVEGVVSEYEDFINEECTFLFFPCEYYKLKNDGLRIHIDLSQLVSGGQGSGYMNLDFNSKGVLFKTKADVSGTIEKTGEKIAADFEMNFNFSI